MFLIICHFMTYSSNNLICCNAVVVPSTAGSGGHHCGIPIESLGGFLFWFCFLSMPIPYSYVPPLILLNPLNVTFSELTHW